MCQVPNTLFHLLITCRAGVQKADYEVLALPEWQETHVAGPYATIYLENVSGFVFSERIARKAPEPFPTPSSAGGAAQDCVRNRLPFADRFGIVANRNHRYRQRRNDDS